MRILILSDSHSYYGTLEKILQRERTADMIVHLGDFADDMNMMNEFTAMKPVVICRGNCDLYGTDYPEQSVFEFAGKKLLCCHGHRHHVKDGLYALYAAGREAGADICCFGHTHSALYEEENGIHLLNPGAVCNGDYATIDINGDDIKIIHKHI